MSKSNYLSESEIIEIENNPSNKKIDFARILKISLPRTDILNSEITGFAGKNHSFGKGNIINSDISNFHGDEVEFEYVDFKDCIVKDTTFKACGFDFGAIINNVFKDCEYDDCHFLNMSITNSQFQNVTFKNCDLKNMVIKGCKFQNCQFINCETSNKLVEFSTILDCQFINTNIQIETITDNFGLHNGQFKNSLIRNGRLRDDHIFLEEEDLFREIETRQSKFDILKLNYFLDTEIFLNGDDSIDELFDIQNWIELCKIPSTFVDYLELFLEFLLHEYQKDNLMQVILLKFHGMTANLVDEIELPPQLYSPVMGVHMTLSRITESFLTLLYSTSKQLKKPDLFLSVNGPLDHSYYYDQLIPIFGESAFKIKEVRKLNSPNLIHLLWENIDVAISIISLVYATRMKVEITRLNAIKSANQDREMTTLPTKSKSEISNVEELQLFNFELGLSSVEEKYLYSLKFRSIMPGNLVADLRLSFNTKILGKLRKILVSVIESSDDPSKAT